MASSSKYSSSQFDALVIYRPSSALWKNVKSVRPVSVDPIEELRVVLENCRNSGVSSSGNCGLVARMIFQIGVRVYPSDKN